MNSELDLLQNILDRNDLQTLNNFLVFCSETRLFSKHPQVSYETIPTVNRLLNDTSKRQLGVRLLKTLLPQCSRKMMEPFVFSWIQMSIRGILTVTDGPLVEDSMNLLIALIPLSWEIPDVRKEVSQNLSWRIVECLVRDLGQSEHKLLALRCLSEFLQSYGKSCGQFKETLSKFLLAQIDRSPEIVHAASQCYLSLASVGSPGSDFENYKTSWVSQQTLLIDCLHYVLNGLLEGIGEIQGPSNPVALSEIAAWLPAITDKLPLLRAMKRASQFKGLGEFLCCMISGRFIANKRLSLESLLSVICRTLAFNCDTVKSNLSIDSMNVSVQVPILHETAINILSSLIASCRMNLITHGELICKLLAQTLKCTQTDEWPFGQTKPFGLVRTSAYNCLKLWVTLSRSSSNVKEVLPNIFNSIMYDVCSFKPALQINVQTKHMKGKEGKKQRQAMLMESLSGESDKICADSDLFIASLKTLSVLFLFCSTQFDLKDVKKLLNEVIHQLKALESQGTPWVAPHDDEACRLELYNTLFTICTLRIPDLAAPLNLAHSLFMDGLKDPSPMVVCFCGLAAKHISGLIQPHAPTLEFQPFPPSSNFSMEPSPSSTSTILLNRSKPAKKLKIRPKTKTLPVDPSPPTVAGDESSPVTRLDDDEPTPLIRLVDNELTSESRLDGVVTSPTASICSSSSSSSAIVSLNGREVPLVSDSSHVPRMEESGDDDVMEIEPSDESTSKRSVENGFEPEVKRAKSSTDEEPVSQKGAVTNACEEVQIDQDMNELEKDMLNSFINVINE